MSHKKSQTKLGVFNAFVSYSLMIIVLFIFIVLLYRGYFYQDCMCNALFPDVIYFAKKTYLKKMIAAYLFVHFSVHHTTKLIYIKLTTITLSAIFMTKSSTIKEYVIVFSFNFKFIKWIRKNRNWCHIKQIHSFKLIIFDIKKPCSLSQNYKA